MRFPSNFGCKIIFMCSVNFLHQQDSNSLFKGSISVKQLLYFCLAFTGLRHRTRLTVWLSASAKQRRKPWSRPPPVYQDLSTRHDWPVKKAIVDFPIKLKGNSTRTSGNLLSLLGAQNKDVVAASQTLLTEVRLRLLRRLGI